MKKRGHSSGKDSLEPHRVLLQVSEVYFREVGGSLQTTALSSLEAVGWKSSCLS